MTRAAGEPSPGGDAGPRKRTPAPVAAAALRPEARRQRLLQELAFVLLAVTGLFASGWLGAPRPADWECRAGLDIEPLRIDVQRAPWYVWALLEGIGESRARRIVAFRESHGPLLAIDDLAAVPGLPQGWLENARQHLFLEGP